MIKFNMKKTLRVAAIFALIAAIYLFLGNSRYFKLDTIDIIDKSYATTLKADDLLPMYKGRNIFGIDINSLSSQIKRDTPTIKYAIVKKILPNKLEIDIIPRIPIAKIKSHGYFPVDRAGMVLSPEIKTEKLPIIMGFSVWVNPKVGTKLDNPQLQNAFLLIDALEEKAILSDYAVSTIDVSNYKNLSFYLENGIEIKIGSEDFPDRLDRLKTTFAKPELDKENIKYIDLRFKDVVIGPK